MYLQRARIQKEQVVARWHLYYKTELSAKDKRRLNQAIEVSKNSDCRHKHGAVLMAGGRVLSVGINSNRNDPSVIGDAQLKYSVHAEIAALRSWGGTNLKNATIYVARLGRSGDPMMSKPCENCQKALKEAGVRKVIYTIDNEMEL